MSSEELPERLSHYTDLNGLFGIVEHKEFWLSNVSFLNDREELSHGLAAAKAIVVELQKRAPEKDMRREILNKLVRRMSGRSIPDTYVACFCEKPDLLSQWRGYGSVQGVSIHFNGAGLKDNFVRSGTELYQVVYGNVQTKKQVEDAIAASVPEIQHEIDWLLGNTDKEIEAEFFKLVSRLAPKFKHSGFEEECEWRLVLQEPDASEIQFRARGKVLLPYVKLPTVRQLPIEAITVGPGDEDGQVAASVQFFLAKRGYTEVSVRRSETPYRT